MMWTLRLLALALLVSASFAADETEEKVPRKGRRKGKLFSLFNIVQFENSACTTVSDSTMEGTCVTKEECMSNGGTIDGNCASGFGVCCSYTTEECGGTITRNCTYIQNTGYPASLATNQVCRWTFNRICDDLCQIRLDFVALDLQQPNAAAGANVGDCQSDTAVATSPSGANPPANLCGTLTGQHMYIETGTTGNAGMFTITTTIANAGRTYKIKVNYIECTNPNKAPDNCLQYFTGVTGSFSSYNHAGGVQLSEQSYAYCFRQEEGYCNYFLSETVGTAQDAFDVSPAAGIAETVPEQCVLAANAAYLRIQKFNGGDQLRCGGALSDVNDDNVPGSILSNLGPPFVVEYFTGNLMAAGLAGFDLTYSQTPCFE